MNLAGGMLIFTNRTYEDMYAHSLDTVPLWGMCIEAI